MAKNADIKTEMSQSGEALQSEKPYIPETAAGDTSKNVLDGNGSAAFKTAHFASSGGSSAAYEQSKGGQSSGATTSGNERGSSVKVAKNHGKVEELESKMSATTASGKAENKTVAKAESGKKPRKTTTKATVRQPKPAKKPPSKPRHPRKTKAKPQRLRTAKRNQKRGTS